MSNVCLKLYRREKRPILSSCIFCVYVYVLKQCIILVLMVNSSSSSDFGIFSSIAMTTRCESSQEDIIPVKWGLLNTTNHSTIFK